MSSSADLIAFLPTLPGWLVSDIAGGLPAGPIHAR